MDGPYGGYETAGDLHYRWSIDGVAIAHDAPELTLDLPPTKVHTVVMEAYDPGGAFARAVWTIRVRPKKRRRLPADLSRDRPAVTAGTRKFGGTLIRILDLAVEREYVARNVATGPVRRVKTEKVRSPLSIAASTSRHCSKAAPISTRSERTASITTEPSWPSCSSRARD